MKSCDIIKPFDQSLYVQFGTTGELRGVSTLRLDRGVTIRRNASAIEALYHDDPGAIVLVEQFSSGSLADMAYEQLCAAVARYARFRRLTSIGKGVVRWGVAPFAMIVFALAFNSAATRMGGAVDIARASAGGAPLVPLPPNMSAPPAAAVPAQRPAVASAPELARAVADGARSGKYTVHRSAGRKGTLYVFSDPLCAHCQELEPELDKLAKDYSIFLFPVSVIGGEASRQHSSRVLCHKDPAKRLAQWKAAVKDAGAGTAPCVDGAAAVAANDQFFRVMRFAGTPAIVNAAGEQVPDAIPNSAFAIDRWMAKSPGASK